MGVALRRDHRDAEALELFRRAFALEPTPHAQAQMGLAEQSLGQWLAADSDLRTALAASPDDWITRNRPILEEALAFVAAHLGWIEISASAVGARVIVDGSLVGTTPLQEPVRARAGEVTVRVEADGFKKTERTVSVSPGARMRQFFALDAADDQSPKSTPSSPAAGSGEAAKPDQSPAAPSSTKAAVSDVRIPWIPIASAMVGVAGLSVGVVYGVDALNAKATRDQHCSAGHCDAVGLQVDADARHDAVLSTIGFGVGAAGLVAAAWLFWRDARHGAASVYVVPSVAPQAAWLGIRSSW
jgi:hypothetical protein